MLRINFVRTIPRALKLLLIVSCTVAGCGAAAAKARVKQSAPDYPTSETSSSAATPAPQLRFFTINAVLAKHDGGARPNAASTQLASAESPLDQRATVRSDMPMPAALQPGSNEPFGLFAFRAPEGLLWSKWRGVEAKTLTDREAIAACRADETRCDAATRKFVGLSGLAAAATGRARIEIVNRTVNRAVRYISDMQQHGAADLWSAPMHTLSAGLGDCEDYALAKMALLQDTGFSSHDLRILLVRDTAVGQDHAVLAVRLDGRWLVLDNRRSDLIETADLPNFMPLFAIDAQGVSLYAAPYAARPQHESETDMRPAANGEASIGGRGLPLML
jgi:predicted transglutaminase-like cysteine proteinase